MVRVIDAKLLETISLRATSSFLREKILMIFNCFCLPREFQMNCSVPMMYMARKGSWKGDEMQPHHPEILAKRVDLAKQLKVEHVTDTS